MLSTLKVRLVLSVAMVLAGSPHTYFAQNEPIVLREFDASGDGFSFREGAVVHIFDPAKHQSVAPFSKVDFIIDFPHGLATNKISLTEDFDGKGGVCDLGKRGLGDVREAPGRGYKPALKLDDIKEGHTYGFLTADGKHYAKLHVIRFDMERKELAFTWHYQSNGYSQVRVTSECAPYIRLQPTAAAPILPSAPIEKAQ